MKYKERPKTFAKYNPQKRERQTVIDIDRDRFDYFAAAFGGLPAISLAIGRSNGYLNHVLIDYDNAIPFPAYIKICDTFELPDKFLMGYGLTRAFERWVRNHKPETKKEKHAVCDEYCKGCMYSSKFSSLMLPVELGCDYMFVTGERRGCPAGTGCDQKKVGVNRQRPLTIIY